MTESLAGVWWRVGGQTRRCSLLDHVVAAGCTLAAVAAVAAAVAVAVNEEEDHLEEAPWNLLVVPGSWGLETD
jgi:hypothetical protein